MGSKIIVTGGGTGGHVFPALSIAEELRARNFEIIYAGSATGFESKVVPQKGFAFFSVDSGAIKNQSLFKKIQTITKLLGGIFNAWKFIGRERPVAVIGVGGYVSVPMGIAAFFRRVPLYLQEQNVSVGIANRTLGKLARRVFLGFAQAETYFPKDRCLVTGNPVRKEFLTADFPKLNPGSNRLLVFGGSQGAKAINDALIEMLPELHRKFPSLSILHQTGERELPRVEAAYRDRFPGKYEIVSFIHDMAGAYAGAAMVVSRSGALTVSELIQVGRPALLVPFPRKGQNDQTSNAYLLESKGVAKVVEQGNEFLERFQRAFWEMLDPKVLGEMSQHFSALHAGNAIVTIGDQIERDLRPKEL